MGGTTTPAMTLLFDRICASRSARAAGPARGVPNTTFAFSAPLVSVVGGGVGTGRDVAVYEGGEEAREDAFLAASLAVSAGLAAGDAVGAVPAVAVAAESVFALVLAFLTVVAGSSGFTWGTGCGVFRTAS